MTKDLEQEKEKVKEFTRRYCELSGYKLNPDTKMAEMVIEGLAKNRVNKGFQYCPCRPLTGDQEQDKLKICPCKWHKDEIIADGHCHCQLFFKP
jgi:ferredoxin-thioredoxin reductase catalytic chain